MVFNLIDSNWIPVLWADGRAEPKIIPPVADLTLHLRGSTL